MASQENPCFVKKGNKGVSDDPQETLAVHCQLAKALSREESSIDSFSDSQDFPNPFNVVTY